MSAASPFEIASEALRRENITRVLALLPRREREVLEMRYGIVGGRARTLEEVFDPTFSTHYKALSSNFDPTIDDITNLTAYLMSIDDATAAESDVIPGIDTVICPSSL